MVVTSRAEEEIAPNMTAGETRSWKRLGQGEGKNTKGESVLIYGFGSGLAKAAHALTIGLDECEVYDRPW